MHIKATIDRFENEKAVLITKDKDEIIWPKNKLPEETTEGMVLNINISNNKKNTEKNKELAKKILNEILNPEN
ncbi:DUF3006 domain-containing protein [Candidatus Parcubacteria bacterium]|nr:DUF3006 domain-containing protein [Candidatus Parcubacteria bacterium]